MAAVVVHRAAPRGLTSRRTEGRSCSPDTRRTASTSSRCRIRRRGPIKPTTPGGAADRGVRSSPPVAQAASASPAVGPGLRAVANACCRRLEPARGCRRRSDSSGCRPRRRGRARVPRVRPLGVVAGVILRMVGARGPDRPPHSRLEPPGTRTPDGSQASSPVRRRRTSFFDVPASTDQSPPVGRRSRAQARRRRRCSPSIGCS